MSEPKPPGVFDILPLDPKEEWRNSHIWEFVEKIMRATAHEYGYQEIRTPIFERTELFTRGIGEGTDIVSKEMYTFLDKSDRSLTLRPEGTAPVMRAFIENGLHNQSPVHKLFYIAPMFRYERAQAGRYRQHHQFGYEAIGPSSPEQDVETIDLAYTLYQRLGLQNLSININSIGTSATREKFRDALKDYLSKSYDQLSDDSRKRFEKNPLRILDSKDPADQKIVAGAPSILDYLDEEGREHFEAVKRLLNQLGIPYKVNPLLVRGLDYYNKTVYEVVAGDLGAQNSIGGGGRYDGLIKQLGGPDLASVGFATGIERVIQTMLKQNVSIPKAFRPIVYFIPLGDKAKAACVSFVHELRKHHLACDMDYTGRKLGKVMQYADTLRAKYTCVIGDNELQTGIVELKEMETGTLSQVPAQSIAKLLQLEINNTMMLPLLEEASKPFTSKAEAEFFLNKIKNTIDQTQQLSKTLQKAMENIQEYL
jgi:histidyl-tRNA synthetase